MTLKVYCTHWSDNKQRWGKPEWIDEGSNILGLPFGYFLAEDNEKAEEYVKTLPNLNKMFDGVVEKPRDLYLGSLNIAWRPE